MTNKQQRFVCTYEEGSVFTEIGQRMILVDKSTGVNYLWIKAGSAASITPLLSADGKPIITYDVE